MNLNKICLVIPCFNEAKRLSKSDYTIFCKKNPNYSLLFVNDGSTDNTVNVIKEIIDVSKQNVTILNLENNVGKAMAVRAGMLKACDHFNYDIIGYIDADLSIPFSEVKRLIDCFKNKHLNFVFASRIQILGSNIKKKLLRHILGRIFATIASNMLKIKVYDTQCGAKFFHNKIVPNLFEKPFLSKWIFDIEIFFRYKTIFNISNINAMAKEVPLENCMHVDGSKIKLSQYLAVPLDLMRIYVKYK